MLDKMPQKETKHVKLQNTRITEEMAQQGCGLSHAREREPGLGKPAILANVPSFGIVIEKRCRYL
jgi:hypothetical protein